MGTERKAEQPPAIEPAAYTEEYYRSGVEGFQEFAASGGRALSPRLERANS